MRAALGDFWAVQDKRKVALTKILWAYVVPVWFCKIRGF